LKTAACAFMLAGPGGTEMDTTYAERGITTPRGAYWWLVFFVVLGVNACALTAVRHQFLSALIGGTWVLGVAIGTLRALRIIVRLDPRQEAARLAFQLAIAQPIVGIVPVVLLLLP
jgi:hypothetical protein